MNRIRVYLLICCFATCISTANAASHTVSERFELQQSLPIELNADSSDFNYDSGQLIFRELHLTQGDLSIKADRAETAKLDFAEGEWVFTGDVEVVAEATTLTCDEARILFSNHQLVRAEISGNPARFKQQVAGTQQTNEGEADRMIYQLDKGILELRQNARFADGSNEISGDQITYDVFGRNLSADSGDSGPVTILIEPPSKTTESEVTP